MTWFWIWVAVSIALIVALRWRGRTVRLMMVGSHHMRVGDGPLRLSSSTGPLPDGIRGDVDYYVVAVDSEHVDLERR